MTPFRHSCCGARITEPHEPECSRSLTITPNALVSLITEMLLVRKGAVIDESVCRERANNIAQALAGYRIMT